MTSRFVTPEELLKGADLTQEIRQDDYFFVAVIQKDETRNSLKVSQTGVSDWIDLPLEMIASAKIVGSASAKGSRYQVALIKLNEPNDPFAKVAYRLLSQLGTVPTRAVQRHHDPQKETSTKKDCDCSEKESRLASPNSTPISDGSAVARSEIRDDSIGVNSLGKFGRPGGNCRFELQCSPCTRCIPWTDICWESDCCNLVKVDCEVGV